MGRLGEPIGEAPLQPRSFLEMGGSIRNAPSSIVIWCTSILMEIVKLDIHL